MRKLLIAIGIWMMAVGTAFAFPPMMGGSGSTWTMTDDCSAVTTNGTGCWDNDTFNLYVGNGTSAQAVGGASGAPTVTVANEATDESSFILFVTAATGALGAKSNTGLTFNSATGMLTATGFTGPLTGTASGNIANTLADAAGDLIQGSADNTWAKLTKGAEGTILRAGASVNAYTTSTFADTYAIGTILHASAANTVTGLTAGADNQLLKGATGAAPAWTAAGTANQIFGVNSGGTMGWLSTIKMDDSAAQIYKEGASTYDYQVDLANHNSEGTIINQPVTSGSGDVTLATKGLVGGRSYHQGIFPIDVNTTSGTWNGVTVYFAQCAASLAFGTPVYIQSTGKPGAANAAAAATMPAIGVIVVASTDADTPCTVLTHGVVSADAYPTFTPGNTVYVDDSGAGVLTATVGDISGTDHVVQVMGIAVGADEIFINPSLATITLE